MTQRTARRLWMLSVVAALAVGTIAGWWLHLTVSGVIASQMFQTAPLRELAARAVGSGGHDDHPTVSIAPTIGGDPIAELRSRRLRLPLDGMRIEAMKGGFAERRGGGSRPHEAVDILAARDTPIRAVDNGTIAKLFHSQAGGITIYQFDPTGRYCYYYAHLQRYAEDLKDGQSVDAGDVIGYVGTTGNAPPNTPHLHFAIFELMAERQWWKGRPIDPFDVYRHTS